MGIITNIARLTSDRAGIFLERKTLMVIGSDDDEYEADVVVAVDVEELLLVVCAGHIAV